ncbi:MAG: DNA/RNA nuclease SfsA [Alphaproteobacteria bacterium GM7ARS4]|nr:DNA/RNA nuclease SfsA [Alphaproteobacteria bacterium GM7ARS4]
MRFDSPLVQATLKKRYKRFLAEAQLHNGDHVIAHCPNPGRMQGLCSEHTPIWLEKKAPRKTRQLAWQWQLTETPLSLVGINTMHANHIVLEALQERKLHPFQSITHIKREVTLDAMRVDFALTTHHGQTLYLEVKSVTMRHTTPHQDATALFPDSVSLRAQKHMKTLASYAQRSVPTAVVFLIQREDCNALRPNDTIDPAYGLALRHAQQKGVRLYAYDCAITPQSITLNRSIPVVLT